MEVLRRFKTTESTMCSCPPRYAINTYSACSHGCFYCYGSRFWKTERPRKREVLRYLKKDAKKKRRKLPVSLSPIVDPYTPEEKRYRVTRGVLEILQKNNYPICIMTKSDLVVRDRYLLKKADSTVSFSITTTDKEKAKLIEPRAPSPEKRIRAMKTLSKYTTVTARIQPLIPYFNNSSEDIEATISELDRAGVKHTTSAVLRITSESWPKLKKVLPRAKEVEKIFFEERDRRAWYWYAPKRYRRDNMKRVAEIAKDHDMSFACCREGFGWLNTGICDAQGFLDCFKKQKKLDEF
ncbi:MAG: radical SAM protein [Candidatus Aenigmatarchaeota archaeon]